MTYEELIVAVERLETLELAHTSPIFSLALKMARNREERDPGADISEALLLTLIAACRDLGTAARALTEERRRAMPQVVFIPTGEWT